MAQQAVFTVLERGCSIAVDEAIYLLGVSDKVESAKKQLQSMQAFLEDLDDKVLRGGAMARNLVSDVRDVAHEVEDINDTANILTRQSDPKTSIKGAISKYVCFPIYLTRLHKLGARIDLANAKMKSIFENFAKLNIAATAIAEPRGYIIEDDSVKHWRSVHPDFGDKVDVIGFDEQIKLIESDLLDKRNRHLTVVSIVGTGGTGKSTMAKKVYGLPRVNGHFKVHAWLTVSHKVVPHDLLKEMVKRLVPSHRLEEMIKRTIGDEQAEEVEYLLKEVEYLLKELIKRTMVDEKTEEARELECLLPLPRHLLEELLKHIKEDEKAKEANKADVLKRVMEDEKASQEEKIKHAIEEGKAKEHEEPEEIEYLFGKSKEAVVVKRVLKRVMEDKKARLKEEIKHAVEEWKAKEDKEYEEFEKRGAKLHLESLLKELIECTMLGEKTEEAIVEKVKELESLVHRDLLEEVLKRIIEDKKAKEAIKLIPRHRGLEELIQRAIENWKAKQSKETEAKYLLEVREVLIMGSMEQEKYKAKKVELEELKEEQLMKLLHKFALSERYLIVLDDIWSTDAWNIIRAALPNKKNGSRVVLTTRNEAIAQYPSARKKIYQPKLLNEEESTRLLLSKALPEYISDGMGQNLDELEKLGKDLAVKCGGLPLAIVVLGGHLSRKPDVAEWKKLTSTVIWHDMVRTEKDIGAVLDLSYYDMPSHLRSCFMYTTALPEDFLVDVRVLANLWIAEGFIPLVRGHTREEIAVMYIAELVQRCMIQVEERTSSGRITVIKVHDILRDWGIGRARREGLIKDCLAAADVSAEYSGETVEAYRVALHGFLASKAGAFKTKPRTLLAFNFSRVDVDTSFKGWHHLRVLHLHSSGEKVDLPGDIRQMRYLRYLGLRGPCTYYLPSSIGDLLSLETMDAIGGQIYSIPSSLWKIPALKYVHVSCARDCSVPQISSQTKVHVMVLNRNSGNLLLEKKQSSEDDVPILSSGDLLLEKRQSSEDDVPILSSRSIIQGTKWQLLKDIPDLSYNTLESRRVIEAKKQQLSQVKNPNLSYCVGMTYNMKSGKNQMEIVGRCKEELQSPNDPPNFENMHDIWVVKICCANFLNTNDKMAELGRMRYLRALEIGERSYTESVIIFQRNSFQCLERLVLHDLPVNEWKVEYGSMTNLKVLTLCMCPNLGHLPEMLASLPYLKKLDLIVMPLSCYQHSTVAQKLKKGCVVSSNKKDFQHLDVPISLLF